jgi:hypothetical protein
LLPIRCFRPISIALDEFGYRFRGNSCALVEIAVGFHGFVAPVHGIDGRDGGSMSPRSMACAQRSDTARSVVTRG